MPRLALLIGFCALWLLMAARAPAHAEPPATRTPLPTPTFTPTPALPTINGLPTSAFVIIPPLVAEHVRLIYAEGQRLGNNPRAYSKVGDSTILNPFFMARFDDGSYHLGAYGFLQPTINYFAGSHGRASMAVMKGLHSWSLFDPLWANARLCAADEGPLACEVRLHRPSFVIIRLGSNDVRTDDLFERSIRRAVEYCIERGVVPVLGTKADQIEGPENGINRTIRRLAAEYNVPLWDFEAVAATVPGRGLEGDGVHLQAFFSHDYREEAAFRRGHGLHNLSALLLLEALWRVVE